MMVDSLPTMIRRISLSSRGENPRFQASATGLEPELGLGILAPHMHVDRLATVEAVEEEPVRPRNASNPRHTDVLTRMISGDPARDKWGQSNTRMASHDWRRGSYPESEIVVRDRIEIPVCPANVTNEPRAVAVQRRVGPIRLLGGPSISPVSIFLRVQRSHHEPDDG